MPFVFSHRNAYPNSAGLEEEAVPLQDLPPIIETPRENGIAGSNAEDRNTRIMEDMKSGAYICIICADPVTELDIRPPGDFKIWQCNACYTSFHIHCIQTWAGRSGGTDLTDLRNINTWKCPCCQGESLSRPFPSCWCKKTLRDYGQRRQIPNSCGAVCRKERLCVNNKPSSARCEKTCHPGPCKAIECLPGHCPLAKTSTRWGRMMERARIASKNKSEVKVLEWTAGLTILCYPLLMWSISLRSKWYTEPYNYRNYNKYESADFTVAILSLFIWGLAFLILTPMLGMTSFNLLRAVLNLDERTPRGKAKVRFAIGIWSLAVFVLWFSPLVYSMVSVDRTWYLKMKDSCNGFNTRINMGGGGYGSQHNITIESLSLNVESSQFYSASHYMPLLNSLDPHQYFQRLTGRTSTGKYIVVDVDIPNRVWSLAQSNETDMHNKYLATIDERITRHSTPTPPPIDLLEWDDIMDGTFTATGIDEDGNHQLHMHIPELNISVSYMYYFRDHVYHESFLRIFDTTGLNNVERDDLLNSEWSSTGDTDRMLARTASFGHGRQRLDMCVREGHVVGQGGGFNDRLDNGGGMSEELFIPFAIIHTIRSKIPRTLRS